MQILGANCRGTFWITSATLALPKVVPENGCRILLETERDNSHRQPPLARHANEKLKKGLPVTLCYS